MPQEPSHRPVPKRLRQFAKNMRHEPTDAEAAMGRLLRDRRLSAYKFRRQVPFRNYILDFVCFDKRSKSTEASMQNREAMRIVTQLYLLKALPSRATGTMTCFSSPLPYWRISLQSLPGGKIPLTRRLTA